MSIAYQYNASGYYVGEGEDFGRLPNNATYTAPELQDGFIPHWNGETWDQIENHIGKEGYVNGKSFTIKEYGILPDGWSDTPPEPTEEEKYFAEKEAIEAKYENGILASLKNAIMASLCSLSPDDETVSGLKRKYQEELAKMKQELDALDQKYNLSEEVA